MTAPVTCGQALAHLQTQPLELPAAVAAHVRACPACAEAQVAWLAQEETDVGLTPAGYFDHLPGRILAKLPPPPQRAPRFQLWAAAAALVLVTGLGGFSLGRRPLAIPVQAALPAATLTGADPFPEVPFQETGDELAQLLALQPDEALAALARLDAPSVGR